VLISLFDEESDDETDLLMRVVDMVNEHFLMPPRRGDSSRKWEAGGDSSRKWEANVDRDREAGHTRMYKDYFDLINLLYK
jgi:hypothetical protein